jgi:hypothetical protein
VFEIGCACLFREEARFLASLTTLIAGVALLSLSADHRGGLEAAQLS